MIDRILDWDKPKHTVEQLENEKADKQASDHEVDKPSERVDDESDEKVIRRQE